jgi:hypothetical protein
MGGEDAVLVGRAGPAHQLERAQVGGDEAEARDPRGHFAASHEELFAGVGAAFEVEADPDNHDEVDGDDGDIECAQVREGLSAEGEQGRQ